MMRTIDVSKLNETPTFHPIRILVNDGALFDGDFVQFEDCFLLFFPGDANKEDMRAMVEKLCADEGWQVRFEEVSQH